MLKRIWASISVLLMLVSLLPLHAAAATEAEEQRIRDQIRTTYRRTLSSSGRESLHGYCGVMAGWELYHLGVTKIPETYNGNEMYDNLSISQQINEGYSAACYSAHQYTLEEALNAVSNFGTEDVYNIMVGFQWTSTAAGSLYGHVTIIHAILNGNVYYTEGFVTPYGADPTQPMVCTIPQFAEYYNSWTRFEGLIHFGSGNRIAGCDAYDSELFVASQEPVALLDEPDFNVANEVRTVQAGERLYATALCQNYEGVLFYRVEENGQEYFISAQSVKPVWFVYDHLTVTELELPQHTEQGEDSWISGVIRSQNAIYNTAVEITDEKGNIVLTRQILNQGKTVDLGTKAFNAQVDISSLAEGNYTYSIYCDISNHYSANGLVLHNMKRVFVGSSSFTVGDAVPAAMSKRARTVQAESKTVSDGWQYANGSWYYYENNLPRTGWFCYEGVDYYLMDDGAAATGWQNINGMNRWFSETGAMRTGWLETDEGCYYMLSNGVPATGLTAVGDSLYYFNEDGKMLTDTTVELAGAFYGIDHSGIVSENQ